MATGASAPPRAPNPVIGAVQKGALGASAFFIKNLPSAANLYVKLTALAAIRVVDPTAFRVVVYQSQTDDIPNLVRLYTQVMGRPGLAQRALSARQLHSILRGDRQPPPNAEIKNLACVLVRILGDSSVGMKKPNKQYTPTSFTNELL